MLFLPHMEFIWAIWVSIDLNVSILSIFKINSKFSHKNGFQNSVYEINDIWNNSIVFSYITAISFTRDKLLNIRKYTPPDISPAFIYSDVLLDIVVGEAAVLFRRFRMPKYRQHVTCPTRDSNILDHWI